MAFYSGGEPIAVKPTSTRIVLQFLVPANTAYTGGWLLASAGINNDGPARIRLIDELGSSLSDWTETSAGMSRLKMSGVNIPAANLPQLVRVEVVNRSTTEQSNASVAGVLLE